MNAVRYPIAAKRPVLYLGGGVINAPARVRELAEKAQLNNRNYAFDLKAANSSLLLHPMAKATDDITYFSSSYTDNVQMMQLSTSDAMGGTMVNEIKDKGWLLFSNIVGANDTNMLSENYSGLVGMINKRINIVQTDYAEVAAKYLKSKGYR